jgi:hypothetical protein
VAQWPPCYGSKVHEGSVWWPALGAWSRGGRRESERSGRALGGYCGKGVKASEALPRRRED